MGVGVDYYQYEVGVGNEGQSWSTPEWRPRTDHWTDVQKIGFYPKACDQLGFTVTPNRWQNSNTFPATVNCQIDTPRTDAIRASADETRYFNYKYPTQSLYTIKQHCGAMITVNGKTMPRYLTKGDTLCKSALVGQSYAEFVEDICSKNLTAEYCACYNRFTDPAFMADGNVIPDEYAACWYKPCVFNTGFKDPRVTSTCETNICQLAHVGSEVSICN